jgi:hypothetical protein
VCNHDSGWEVYDADLAGCLQCGEQHICEDGKCKTEENEQGHSICPITGLCVRTLNFSDAEYVDTICHEVKKTETSSAQQEQEKISCSNISEDLVLSSVRNILCGSGWERSMKLEMERFCTRWKACMLKSLKNFKHKNPGFMPIIPKIVASVAYEAGAGRLVINPHLPLTSALLLSFNLSKFVF